MKNQIIKNKIKIFKITKNKLFFKYSSNYYNAVFIVKIRSDGDELTTYIEKKMNLLYIFDRMCISKITDMMQLYRNKKNIENYILSNFDNLNYILSYYSY